MCNERVIINVHWMKPEFRMRILSRGGQFSCFPLSMGVRGNPPLSGWVKKDSNYLFKVVILAFLTISHFSSFSCSLTMWLVGGSKDIIIQFEDTVSPYFPRCGVKASRADCDPCLVWSIILAQAMVCKRCFKNSLRVKLVLPVASIQRWKRTFVQNFSKFAITFWSMEPYTSTWGWCR